MSVTYMKKQESGKLCFNETITHSTTKHHLVSPGTIVECKEIR